MKSKNIKYLLGFVLILVILIANIVYFYKRDRNKYEPRLWIGFFDYRLNFRDVGESLNQCLNKQVFQTNLIFRSNRYFSGWSCNKIHNPHKIYSLNFSPWNPHAYYCQQSNGQKLYGFHPNTSFEISDIEELSNWDKPEFKNAMCSFFKNTLDDLVNKQKFLFHCDMGRDRTGAFSAMLTMLLAEQKNIDKGQVTDAIECDYEKTSSLEKGKIGKMKIFLNDIEQRGGVSSFIQTKCSIDKDLFKKAADSFISQ